MPIDNSYDTFTFRFHKITLLIPYAYGITFHIIFFDVVKASLKNKMHFITFMSREINNFN